MEVQVRTDVSPSLHPAVIEHIDNYSAHSGYLEGARAAFQTAYENLGAIHDARKATKQDPTLNDAARLLAVADVADRRELVITRTLDKTRGDLESAVKLIEGQLNEPLKVSANDPVNAEIRAHAKSLPQEKRLSFISDALAANDVKTLHAVLGAPAYLSGVSNEVCAAYTRRFHEQQKPELSSRLDATKKALELIAHGESLIWEQIPKARGSSYDEVRRTRAKKAEADWAFNAVK